VALQTKKFKLLTRGLLFVIGALGPHDYPSHLDWRDCQCQWVWVLKSSLTFPSCGPVQHHAILVRWQVWPVARQIVPNLRCEARVLQVRPNAASKLQTASPSESQRNDCSI